MNTNNEKQSRLLIKIIELLFLILITRKLNLQRSFHLSIQEIFLNN